jgi:response regulator RpfG family c-di-GMP phosphodiesterase
VVALGATTALTHHERWDGEGYPQRLVGSRIPIEGRIAALADVFDAMTSHRAYRRALPVDRVVEHIVGQRGRHSDPQIVDLFTGLVDDFLLVMSDHPDPEPERGLRVLVVDGQLMYAETVVRLLHRDPGMEPVATAGTLFEAVAMATDLRPDVVLMDVELPDGDGLDGSGGCAWPARPARSCCSARRRRTCPSPMRCAPAAPASCRRTTPCTSCPGSSAPRRTASRCSRRAPCRRSSARCSATPYAGPGP